MAVLKIWIQEKILYKWFLLWLETRLLIQMCILISNAYQSNSCGKNKCVRLCKYKEVRINMKTGRGSGGRNLHSIYPSLSNFPVCKKLLSHLNSRTDHDLVWLVDKILCKCVAHLNWINWINWKNSILFYFHFSVVSRSQSAPSWLKTDFFSKIRPLQTHRQFYTEKQNLRLFTGKQKLGFFSSSTDNRKLTEKYFSKKKLS